MKKKLVVISAFVSVILFGCNYDNYQNAHPAPKAPATCDTTHVMSFANDVEPIFAASCLIGCHSSSSATAGVVLDTYQGSSKQARNGQLVVSITHSVPNSTPTTWMPSVGTLSACDKAKIIKWVNAGYPNN